MHTRSTSWTSLSIMRSRMRSSLRVSGVFVRREIPVSPAGKTRIVSSKNLGIQVGYLSMPHRKEVVMELSLAGCIPAKKNAGDGMFCNGLRASGLHEWARVCDYDRGV